MLSFLRLMAACLSPPQAAIDTSCKVFKIGLHLVIDHKTGWGIQGIGTTLAALGKGLCRGRRPSKVTAGQGIWSVGRLFLLSPAHLLATMPMVEYVADEGIIRRVYDRANPMNMGGRQAAGRWVLNVCFVKPVHDELRNAFQW